MASYNQPTASQSAGPNPTGAGGGADGTPPDGSGNKRQKTESEEARYLCVHCLEDGKIDILAGYNGLRKHQGRVHNCWMTIEDRLLCPKCGQGFDRRDKNFPRVRTVPEDHRNLPDCTDPKHQTKWKPQPAHDAIEQYRRADIWAPSGGALMNPVLILRKDESIFQNDAEAEKRWDAVSQRYNTLRGQRPLPGLPFAAPPLQNAAPVAHPPQQRNLLPARNSARAGAYFGSAPQNAMATTFGSSSLPTRPRYPQMNMGYAQQQQPAVPSLSHPTMGMPHVNNMLGQQQPRQPSGTFVHRAQPAAHMGGNSMPASRHAQQYPQDLTMHNGGYHQTQSHGAHARPGIGFGGDVVGRVGQQMQHLRPMREVATDVPGNWAPGANLDFGMEGLGLGDVRMTGLDAAMNDISQEMDRFVSANSRSRMQQPSHGATTFDGMEMQQNAAMTYTSQDVGLAAPGQPYGQPSSDGRVEMGPYHQPNDSGVFPGYRDADEEMLPGAIYGSSGEILQDAGMDFVDRSGGFAALPQSLEGPDPSGFPRPRPPPFGSSLASSAGMRRAGYRAANGTLLSYDPEHAEQQPLAGPSGTSIAGRRRTHDKAFGEDGSNGLGFSSVGAPATQRSQTYPPAQSPRQPRGRGAMGKGKRRAIEPQSMGTIHEEPQLDEPAEALDRESPWTFVPSFEHLSTDDDSAALFAGVVWTPLEAPVVGDAAAAPAAPAMGPTEDFSSMVADTSNDALDFGAESLLASSEMQQQGQMLALSWDYGVDEQIGFDNPAIPAASETQTQQEEQAHTLSALLDPSLFAFDNPPVPAASETQTQREEQASTLAALLDPSLFALDNGISDTAPETTQQRAHDPIPDLPTLSPGSLFGHLDV